MRKNVKECLWRTEEPWVERGVERELGNIEQWMVALNARGNTGRRNNITTRATGKWWERTERNRGGGVYGCTLADGVGSWTE